MDCDQLKATTQSMLDADPSNAQDKPLSSIATVLTLLVSLAISTTSLTE